MDREYIDKPGSAFAVTQAEYDARLRKHQMMRLLDTPKLTEPNLIPNLGKAEYTGGSVNYYRVVISKPTSPNRTPYEAECNDIIEALGMNYAEGNAFKAIWRSCAARTLGVGKEGYKDGKYDAEKVVFFGQRMVKQFEG